MITYDIELLYDSEDEKIWEGWEGMQNETLPRIGEELYICDEEHNAVFKVVNVSHYMCSEDDGCFHDSVTVRAKFVEVL